MALLKRGRAVGILDDHTHICMWRRRFTVGWIIVFATSSNTFCPPAKSVTERLNLCTMAGDYEEKYMVLRDENTALKKKKNEQEATIKR